jgi:hypothetical protein
MSESMRMWVEVSFNVAYLIVVWSLVFVMWQRQTTVAPTNRVIATRILQAFALLALGDTGHVGFRVVAYAIGGLETNPTLVGTGAFATAVTVTFFYMLMVDIWRLRFKQSIGWFGWLLLAAGVVRLSVMLFPQNNWSALTAPYDWSLLRNGLLTFQGLGVMYLILRDAIKAQDKTFTWIGVMIALSYTFYAPVILWSAAVPLLGMLMIPKTLAYLGVAFLAYNKLYSQPAAKTATA